MPATKYTYSVQNDFPNHCVNPTTLSGEISASAIVAALDFISVNSDNCDIWFKEALSQGDETILDGIVAAHTGTAMQSQDYMPDGRLRTYESTRPFGNRIMFLGCGDSMSNNYDIGGGSAFKIVHPASGGNNPEVLYCDWNTIENQSYLYLCMAVWDGMDFDELTATMVPRVTATSGGSNTNYNIYGGYLIIPASGDGTTVVAAEDMELIQVMTKEDGTRPAGYWNADYNTTTHLFENVTAAPAGDGAFNMFSSEITFALFAKKMYLRGATNGWAFPPSKEADGIGHGYRMKISIATNGDDHAWTFACVLNLYRKYTC